MTLTSPSPVPGRSKRGIFARRVLCTYYCICEVTIARVIFATEDRLHAWHLIVLLLNCRASGAALMKSAAAENIYYG